jgi:hypothetical protein
MGTVTRMGWNGCPYGPSRAALTGCLASPDRVLTTACWHAQDSPRAYSVPLASASAASVASTAQDVNTCGSLALEKVENGP